MNIKSIALKNYRNYKEELIDFNEGINIIYGNNAQGKTNILEAIYLCATSKSHRTNNDKELINLLEEEAHVKCTIEKNDITEVIDIHLRKNNKKGIAVNRLPIKKLNELFGIMNIIIFSPEDLGLIKNGPKERRRFMNIELCQLNPIYYYHLQQYDKVLKQRNNLLKTIKDKKGMEESLYIWNEQLVKYGSLLIEERSEFLDNINDIIYHIHNEISGNTEEVKIIYEKNVEIERFEKKLKDTMDKDIRFGSTSVGPHRDDILILVNGIDIRKFGSQGQQRTAALSLKLAEIQLVREKIKEQPILLLDDVLSELDKNRQKYLIDFLVDIQTIITCTGIEDYIKNNVSMVNLYRVENGHVVKNEA